MPNTISYHGTVAGRPLIMYRDKPLGCAHVHTHTHQFIRRICMETSNLDGVAVYGEAVSDVFWQGRLLYPIGQVGAI